jgi:hypothetical protein
MMHFRDLARCYVSNVRYSVEDITFRIPTSCASAQLVWAEIVMNWAGILDVLDKNKTSQLGVKNHITVSSLRGISQWCHVCREFHPVTIVVIITFGNARAMRIIIAQRIVGVSNRVMGRPKVVLVQR